MKFVRINIIAEGQTEMEFCRQVLNPYFNPKGIFIESCCVQTSRNRHKIFRGGLLDYQRAKADILRWIKEEKSGAPYFSTMFDLYVLPDDFPGFEQAQHYFPFAKLIFHQKPIILQLYPLQGGCKNYSNDISRCPLSNRTGTNRTLWRNCA